MASQKDYLQKVAEDFSLIDECFPISNRYHQNTEARLHPTMGWAITTRYSSHDHQEYEDQNCNYKDRARPKARSVLRWPVVSTNSSDHVMKSADQVYVQNVTKANHANQVPFKTKDDVFSGNQMETQGQNRRNSYQVVPPSARTNKSNFGRLFAIGKEYKQIR